MGLHAVARSTERPPLSSLWMSLDKAFNPFNGRVNTRRGVSMTPAVPDNR